MPRFHHNRRHRHRRRHRVLFTPANDNANFFFKLEGDGKYSLNGFVPRPSYTQEEFIQVMNNVNLEYTVDQSYNFNLCLLCFFGFMTGIGMIFAIMYCFWLTNYTKEQQTGLQKYLQTLNQRLQQKGVHWELAGSDLHYIHLCVDYPNQNRPNGSGKQQVVIINQGNYVQPEYNGAYRQPVMQQGPMHLDNRPPPPMNQGQMYPGMQQGNMPPPPMNQGQMHPGMQQGNRPPPPMNQGQMHPGMQQGNRPPPPMNQNMQQGLRPPPPMTQGQMHPGMQQGNMPPPPMTQGQMHPGMQQGNMPPPPMNQGQMHPGMQQGNMPPPPMNQGMQQGNRPPPPMHQ